MDSESSPPRRGRPRRRMMVGHPRDARGIQPHGNHFRQLRPHRHRQCELDRSGAFEWRQPQQRQVDAGQAHLNVELRPSPAAAFRGDQVDDQHQLAGGKRLDVDNADAPHLQPAAADALGGCGQDAAVAAWAGPGRRPPAPAARWQPVRARNRKRGAESVCPQPEGPRSSTPRCPSATPVPCTTSVASRNLLASLRLRSACGGQADGEAGTGDAGLAPPLEPG